MMRVWYALLIFIVSLGSTFASETDRASLSHSQKRNPSESYRDVLRKYVEETNRLNPPQRNGPRSAIDAAVHYEFLDFSKAAKWESSLPAIYNGFTSVRDERFLFAKNQSDFARRIPWLYPDDGCYTRSALQGIELGKLGYTRPSKIFVFGDLELRTPNHPDHLVTWWYHQANAVSDGKNIWILDPAVEAKRPIHLIEWLTSITRKPDSTFIAICSSYTYSPSHPCFTATPDFEKGAEKDIKEYLDEEWNRVKDLKRNPDRELGDSPPWKD